MDLRSISVNPRSLLLDPNNYRFHDLDSFRSVSSRARFGDPNVQNRAIYLLQTNEKFELQALKDSIQTNGYVPIEHVVLEKYDETADGERYLVIEGNRRVAAVKILLDEHEKAVIELPEGVLQSLNNLPAYLIEGADEERSSYKQTIMAIRHVAGITEWGPYQQAKLVRELFEQEENRFGKVAQRIGISATEVGRRYRAIKALEQMEQDEEYGDIASPKLYSFFHEAVSSPVVRTWLGWSDQTYEALDLNAKQAFYSIITPQKIDGETKPAKIQDVRQVRELKNIVNKELPRSILLDPDQSFQNAIDAARSETLDISAGRLEHAIAQAIRQLNEPPTSLWFSPTSRVLELWSELTEFVHRMTQVIEQ